MFFSSSTVIMTTFISSIIIILITALTYIEVIYLKRLVKFCLYLVALIIIRLMLPFEFPFTKTLPNTSFMPFIQSILYSKIPYIYSPVQNTLCFIWIVGIIFFAFRSTVKYYTFNRLIRCIPSEHKYDAILKKVVKHYTFNKNYEQIKIITIPDISSPAIVGLFRPMIILPSANLDENEIFYILAHELQHYKHKDLFFKFICEITKILYWWNPILRLLCKQLNTLSEINTDLETTRQLNEQECVDYLDCLLKLSRFWQKTNSSKLTLAFSSENSTTLSKRFHIILSSNKNISSRKYNIATLLICITFLLLSYSVTFEAYVTDAKILDNTIPVNTNTFYLLENNGKYELYINDKYVSTFTTKDLKGFEGVPIYKHQKKHEAK